MAIRSKTQADRVARKALRWWDGEAGARVRILNTIEREDDYIVVATKGCNAWLVGVYKDGSTAFWIVTPRGEVASGMLDKLHL